MAKIIKGSNGSKVFTGKANNAKLVKGKEIVVAKNPDDVETADVVVSDGAGQAPGEGRIVLAQADTAAAPGSAAGTAAPAEAGAAGTAAGAETGTAASAAAAGGAVGGVAAISEGTMALIGVGLAAVAVGVGAGSNSDSTPAPAAAAADTAAPAAPLALDLAAADDSGSLNTDNITRNTTALTISGTAEAGSTVRIYDTDGTTLLGTGTATNGNFAIDVSLAAGSHTLTAKATDAAGNASVASAGLGITVDTTAPAIQSMTSAGNQVVLTYDSALDGANIPVVGDFAVTVGGVPNAVTNVAVAGAVVTLTLTAAVVAGDAVQVTYTDPTVGDDAAATQDVAGNDAVGFTSGVVADGYVHGAQIYIDTDNDGVADPGEAVAGVVTDATGNFFLPAGSPAGTIIAVGGVNDSGLLNTIPLKAPTGSTMVTPLTTLVQAYIEANVGTTVADASAAVVTALSLPGGTDLMTYDPIAVLASAPADATALAVQKAAVQVATVVALAASAPVTVTGEEAANTVVENLVTQMGAPTAITPIDLTAGAVITTALGTVSSAALADITTATTAIGVAANLGQIDLAQSVALDNLAPSAPTLDLVAASDTGISAIDNITSDTSPTIRVSFDAIATDGTAAAVGDTVTVLEGAATVGTAILTSTDTANGYVDVTLAGVTDASHPYTATIADIAGNVSTASGALAVTVDTAVPAPLTVALTTDSGSGAADLITNVGTLNITGTEADATVQYSTDGGTTWTNSFAAAEGANTVQVRQVDLAGNASAATAALAFTLDTTIAAPTVALTTDSGSSTDNISNVGTLNITGTEAGATVQYSTDGGTTWGSSFTAAQGANAVQIRQIDVAGNTSTAASLAFTLDTAAPTLSSTTPVDGAIDVVGNSIVLTFAEAVAAGTGDIVLSDGTTTTNIPVTDSQIAISGNTVTITPTLSPNTTYAVTIASGVLTDVAGNAFAGIASGALDFTMANNPSVTVTTSEGDNLLNVGDTATITFTLSEASSNFTAADVTVTGGTLSNFSGTGTTYTATLTPTSSSTTAATVSVGSGTFTSATGLGNIASSPLNINVDTVPPTTPTVALTTNSGSTSDSITNNAALTFSAAAGGVTRSISVDSGAGSATYTAPTTDGTHTVTVTDTDTAGNTATASITFTLDTTIATPTVALTTNSGSTADSITNSAALTVSTAATDVTRTYAVDGGTASTTYTAPTTAASHTVVVTDTDTAGNTANASITFTLDTTAPTLSTSTPADNATGVPPSGNIVLTFNENVAAGTGNIVISDGTNSTTISVTDASQVTFSGTTVTINPTDDASPSTSYNVQLASGAITDTAGNAYAGIANATTLNFTTAAAPTITSSLDNVTNFEVTSNIVLNASENVTAVAGKYITIINDGGTGFHGEATVNTQQILVTDTSKVTIANDIITINPGFDLDFANDYHIMVDAGAFLGVTSGQGSVATADAAAMNFSTVNPSATATAAASQMMASGTDAMVAGHAWWDAEGNGSPATSAVARDFSGGDHAITANDLATTGIATNDFYIAVNNFGTGDLIYFDNHGDNAVQRQADFDAGMIIDFGTPPTVISAAASGTATGTNGGQFDVTLEGALAGNTFSDTAALQTLLSASYQPILYG